MPVRTCNLVFVIAAFLLGAALVVFGDDAAAPAAAEQKLIKLARIEPTAESRAALGSYRYVHAVHDYHRWEKTGDAAVYRRALVYAESACRLAPAKAEHWFFKGLLLARMDTDKNALKQATLGSARK